MKSRPASLLKAFLREPFIVGSIAPSSKALGLALIANTQPNSRVIEIGPGTGAVTRLLMRRLKHSSQYLGIEIHPKFVEILRRDFPQAKFIEGSAENLRQIAQESGFGTDTDHIVSSLPWSILASAVQDKILGELRAFLSPEGSFTTFVYLHSMTFPTSRRFFHQLEESFEDVSRSPLIWRNLPPAIVFTCRRPRR